MKITISSTVINAIMNFARCSDEAYKDIFPTDENRKYDFTIDDIKIINRKWGSITRNQDDAIIEINDKFISDILNMYGKVNGKFAPIVGIAKYMISMFKKCIEDVKELLTPIIEEYTEEYEYTVCKVVNPAVVKIGYVIMKRVKGDSTANEVCNKIFLVDDMDGLNPVIVRSIINDASAKTVKLFNENPHVNAPVFDSVEDAMNAVNKFIELFYEETSDEK